MFVDDGFALSQTWQLSSSVSHIEPREATWLALNCEPRGWSQDTYIVMKKHKPHCPQWHNTSQSSSLPVIHLYIPTLSAVKQLTIICSSKLSYLLINLFSFIYNHKINIKLWEFPNHNLLHVVIINSIILRKPTNQKLAVVELVWL